MKFHFVFRMQHSGAAHLPLFDSLIISSFPQHLTSTEAGDNDDDAASKTVSGGCCASPAFHPMHFLAMIA